MRLFQSNNNVTQEDEYKFEQVAEMVKNDISYTRLQRVLILRALDNHELLPMAGKYSWMVD
tara:strand:+ start:80 stop:262 length:183 start_codon:yes stop_codon:yes gene_type:complete